jgi:phage terminase large subunit
VGVTTSLWPTNDTALVPSRVFAAARGEGGPMPHVAYQERPEDWIVEKLGIPRETLRWSLNPGYRRRAWDGTPDPLSVILEALANWEDVGVEAATGTQKSFTAACIIFWFLACWRNSLVNTYAPKEDQLRLYIWKEITELWPRFQKMFPTAELTDLRIRMNGTDKWSAHGIATQLRAGEESATKAQGAHAEHMLTVTEETPGIESAIMKALRMTRTGDHNLQLSLGNPDDMQDTLHQFCVLPDTRHVIISALDHPNVVTGTTIVPGAASPAGIRRIAAEDPEGTPLYNSRVRGISPAEAIDSLIKLAWVQRAAARWKEAMRDVMKHGGARALGVDVANSERGDKASKAYFIGACLQKVVSKQCPNSNLLGAEVVEEATELGIDPAHIGVDPVGVGAGTVNEMVRLHMEPRRLGGSESPVQGAQRAPDGQSMDFAPDANLFNNLRSQMAWQLREDFRLDRIAVPDDPKLHAQLTALQYEKRGGKVILEEKAKVRRRLGRSPDDFDAIMYGNWVRPRSPIAEDRDAGDDRNPGFDYKRKRRLPRHRPIPEPGADAAAWADDDLRPNHFSMAGYGAFRVPSFFGGTPGDDDNESE